METMDKKERRLLYYYIIIGLAVSSFLFLTIPFMQVEYSGYNERTGETFSNKIIYDSVLTYFLSTGGDERAYITVKSLFSILGVITVALFDVGLIFNCISKIKHINTNGEETHNKLGDTIFWIVFSLVYALAFITTPCEAGFRSGPGSYGRVITENKGSLAIGSYLEFFVLILIALFFLLIYLVENKKPTPNLVKEEINIEQSAYQELLRWKEMLDNGVISQEEFEEIKRKIINKIQ